MIEARALKYHTPSGRQLAQEVNFSLSENEILVVNGPNGVGKSTLLKILQGQLPYEGELEMNISQTDIGIFPQLGNLQFHIPLTLRDCVELSCKAKESEILNVGLLSGDQLELSWNTASGGERARTLLTRLLLLSPQLLLLDEPLNHIDPETQSKIVDVLIEYLSSPKRAVLMVSHTDRLDRIVQRSISLKTLEMRPYAL